MQRDSTDVGPKAQADRRHGARCAAWRQNQELRNDHAANAWMGAAWRRWIIVALALTLVGCESRSNLGAAASQAAAAPMPTATPTYELVPTFTPTRAQVALTPKPTRTPTPVPTLLPTRPPRSRVIVDRANVRAGPGTVYAIVDALARGSSVRPLQRTRDGQWIKLSKDRRVVAVSRGQRSRYSSCGGRYTAHARADLHADTAGLDRASRIIAGV